jgi:hypothetical protein
MRTVFAVFVAVALAGCTYVSDTSSENTVTNPDGTTTTTKTKTWTKNGVSGGEKTETTTGKDGKLTVVTYEKQNGEWVKKQ